MSHSVESRTYRRHECAVFRKTKEAFGGLSNMASGYPLMINGIPIRTSEALYQACRFPHMPDVQRLIIDQHSPMTAKMKSKPHRSESRADWERILTKIMRWCLRVKLAQNWEQFSHLLLSTGDLSIVEESRKDDFWGAKSIDDDSLVGANVLGRLLMELREDLRNEDIEKLRHVEPPDVPDLLLFGQPIRTVEASGARAAPNSVAISNGGELSKDDSPQPFGGVLPAGEGEPSHSAPSLLSEERPQTVGSSSIPKECKRLAEVDFPIAVVSKHSVREKSINHGHPCTLHLWWARRPLGACRSMLLALLLPDPVDGQCPNSFREAAREILASFPVNAGKSNEDLRIALFAFLADLAKWEFSANSTWVQASRALLKAAWPESTPVVVDPFSGGGAIPLEALRVGCDAIATDLNPVSVLILKVLLEDLPRRNGEQAEEIRKAGSRIRETVAKRLAPVYPVDGDGATPIVYFWARTVICEAPRCGAEIPLLRSMWLSKRAGRKRAFRYQVIGDSETPRVELEIFEPRTDADVGPGFVAGSKARCPCCGTVTSGDRVRAQLKNERGGAEIRFSGTSRTGGARLIAVLVTSKTSGRSYRLPTKLDMEALLRVDQLLGSESGSFSLPDEPVNPIRPSPKARGLSAVTRYGVETFGDLFTARQKLALRTFAETIRDYDGPEALKRALTLAFGRSLEQTSSMVRWISARETIAGTFGRQALAFMWDFAEVVPTGTEGSNFLAAVEWVAKVVERQGRDIGRVGQVDIADAASSQLPDESCDVWFTDPPYYDAIPYADLSDYFFVWFKRILPNSHLLKDPFDASNSLTPKLLECVWNQSYEVDGKIKNGRFFEDCISKSFAEGRRILNPNGVGCVVFAHPSTEGWEAFLSGMIRGEWVITASWPIATERPGRLQSQNSAALATSVHLVCRPRPENAPIGDWADVLLELPKRVGDWMERLQNEGIRGADLVFACIGPALEIFSRYSRVETAEGREVRLPEYLEKVWEVVGRAALEQVLGTAEAQTRNGLAGALEEDARLTALFLWSIQSTNGNAASNGGGDAAEDEDIDEEEAPRGKSKGYSLIFDVVRRFAQPLGIHLPDWEDRIIETKKGVVRLLPVSERAKQLFGESGAQAVADEIEYSVAAAAQLSLFPEEGPTVRGRGRRRAGSIATSTEPLETSTGATTLDRVHAAMLLQSSGRSQALRNLLKAEQERGPDFLRLANALSALYPRGSEEKRLLDAMLLAVPR